MNNIVSRIVLFNLNIVYKIILINNLQDIENLTESIDAQKVSNKSITSRI